MMRLLLAFGVLFGLSCRAAAQNGDILSEVSDRFMISLVNDIEILAERRQYYTGETYFIRLVGLRSPGECDGTPESCPMESVFIGISKRGDVPIQKVFELQKSYDWEFSKWVSFTTADGVHDFIEFDIERTIIAEDIIKQGWWTKQMCRVKANVYSATIACQ